MSGQLPVIKNVCSRNSSGHDINFQALVTTSTRETQHPIVNYQTLTDTALQRWLPDSMGIASNKTEVLRLATYIPSTGIRASS